ncbi:MAG: hypothetical protein FOGNACKC_00923 [Anaerolineae bacterium]|nr:hypothetical protein [Anaerolineae bacterium]
MFTEVTLSDEKPCRVRQLDLFELDDVGPEDPGPFTYKVKTGDGQEYDIEYDLEQALRRPPKEPQADDSQWVFTEWVRYQAALKHHGERVKAAAQWQKNVLQYILQNCLDAADRDRVVTEADYEAVSKAAHVPQLKLEDLEDVLQNTFPGILPGQTDFSGDESDEGWAFDPESGQAVGISGDDRVADV